MGENWRHEGNMEGEVGANLWLTKKVEQIL